MNRSANTLINLLVLNRHDQDGRAKWTMQLQESFPAEPLVAALRCLDDYDNLALDPPAACAEVDWALTRAQHRHREYTRLSRTIADYLSIAAEQIDKLQAEVDRYGWDQIKYRDELETLQRQASQLGWIAAGEFALDILPLPKSGDTLESYAVREGLCAVKWVNWVCAIGSAGNALSRMDQRKAELSARAKNLVDLINGAEWLAQYDRDRIQEWQSGKKLQDYKADLDNQHRWFWGELDNEIFRHCPELGLDIEHVLNDVAGRR
ncbi:MAG TPA: hypothetical protein VI485_03960 [Vicinamibacterales bacterium]|nr:hypothetical protein [Vicinamibacterales bacterium]